MNKRRLLKLADLLESDAKNKQGIKFDLDIVGRAADWQDGFKGEMNCGTTACAMGLAAISGAFNRAGLSFRLDGSYIETTLNGRVVEFDRAAMKIFDLSEDEADFLFTTETYPLGKTTGAAGERFVAKRIRDLVAGKITAPPRSSDWF